MEIERMINPLEQFEIKEISVGLGPVTNLSVYMIIPIMVMGVMVYGMVRGEVSRWIGNRWMVVVEMIVGLIKSMGKGGEEEYPMGKGAEKGENRGYGGGRMEWLPLIIALFMFILLSNVFGMIPYSFTPTSHLIITIYLSVTIMVGVTLIGIMRNKLRFFNLFLPEGTPIVLIPLLIPIEMMSYLSRAFSLGIRLGANVTSGHSLLKIMSAMSYKVGVILPMGLLVPLIGLEIGIGVIQAYLFIVLMSSYLNEVVR